MAGVLAPAHPLADKSLDRIPVRIGGHPDLGARVLCRLVEPPRTEWSGRSVESGIEGGERATPVGARLRAEPSTSSRGGAQ